MSPPGPATAVDADGWQRLDTRMLLVHPIRELVRFLPVLIGLFVAGQASTQWDPRWQLWGIVVPVGLGVMRYLTTTFRVDDELVELRRGLLDRHLLSVRVERVRTVDLTSSPIHRLLGLTTVRIGTGTASASDEDHLDLDGLPPQRARELRAQLLRAAPAGPEALANGDAAAEVPPPRELVRLDPAWARYAPLTSSGFVLAAATVGAATQIADGIGILDGIDVEATAEDAAGAAGLLVPVLAGLLVLVAVLAVAAYLVANWGFTLSRGHDGTWHVRRGLLTTRETSLDGERVTGVSLGEPVGLRIARGARLAAIATGLARQQATSTLLVPPAPRRVVEEVATGVLGATDPVTGPLRPHGPRAARRRWTRALVPAGVVAAAAVVAVVLGAPGWLLGPGLLAPVLAGALAADRVRALGHGLLAGYLVTRSGSLYRHREAVRADTVIGFVYRASWFQRRAGLTSLVATIAGGRQSVTALDVPEADAVAVSVAALPGLVEQFLAEPAP